MQKELLQQTTEEWFFKTLEKADLLFAFLHEFGKGHWHAENWHSSGWWFTDDTIQYRCEDLFDNHSDGYNWTFESNDSFRQMLIYILKSHGFDITHNSGDEEDGLFIMKRPAILALLEEKEEQDVSDEEAAEDYCIGEYGVGNTKMQAFRDYLAGRQSLRHLIERLQQENETLGRWKAEQIAVTPDMQAIGKAFGVGMGQSVHDKILPAINALKSKLEKKDALLEEMSRVINSALALPMISQYFSEKMNTLLTKYNEQKV